VLQWNVLTHGAQGADSDPDIHVFVVVRIVPQLSQVKWFRRIAVVAAVVALMRPSTIGGKSADVDGGAPAIH